jgi:TPR repeat protein
MRITRSVGRALALAPLVFAASVGVASANDQPNYGPPEAWVRDIPLPKPAASSPDGAPTETLLDDVQVKMGDAADSLFVERAVMILAPEGMAAAAGAISKTWDPDTEDLTINRLRIIRGDQVIDVLEGGKKLLVLRRENNLELAMLDGRLTATLEPEGLKVGDIIDFAYSFKRHDPALKGRSEDLDALHHAGVAAEVYWREFWPPDKAIRWRSSDDMPPPTITRTAEGTEVVYDLKGVMTPKPPRGAPPRFYEMGAIEFSQFGSWSMVSSLLSPLYEKAATLAPDSPLRAEVARIAAESPDPKKRAEAALRLVEDQTRYVFLGMNDGGLVPADADQTWSRRFGDCKGKTALLVAVLRALGVTAEPVVVSATFGDGMDQRLPMAGWFDHAIVRAEIAGKTYWLDGTRIGDRSLDDLVTPPYYWALPIRAAGGELIRLDPTPLDQPATEEVMNIDASKGADAPAPTHIDVTYRGEDAVRLRGGIASVPRSDYERYLREFWTKMYPWLEVASVAIVDDPDHNVAHLTADGTGRLDWSGSPDGARVFRVPLATLGADISFKREPGPHSDAPYAVQFPAYATMVRHVTLPSDGDFTLIGSDVDAKTGGLELRRRARIEGGVLTVEASTRSFEREFPASEADAASAQLRELARNSVAVGYKVRSGAPPAPAALASPSESLLAAQKGDPSAELRLATMYLGGKGMPYDIEAGMGWLRKAAEGGDMKAQAMLGALLAQGVNGAQPDYDAGRTWLTKAATQGDPTAQAELGGLYLLPHGEAPDPTTALLWIRKSAQQGDPIGEYYLGHMYLDGKGVARDAPTAVEWLRKSADQGLGSSQGLLARLLIDGQATPRDAVAGLAYARKAADQGDPEGAYALGLSYREGVGVPKDDAQALDWFRKSAASDPDGAAAVALAYYNGSGVPIDYAQAAEWYRKAAEAGSVRSARDLGFIYLHGGPNLPADPAQARVWYGKAAAAGDPLAQNSLGTLYERGEGGAVDLAEAAANYKRAAEQGNLEAEYNVGMCYLKGRGVAVDASLAVHWLQPAADAGSPLAALELGKLYLHGQGAVAADPKAATAWLNKAAAEGSAEAKPLLAGVMATGASVDTSTQLAYYRDLAAKGDVAGQRKLGLMLRDGVGVPSDPVGAFVWLYKAAEAGDPEAEMAVAEAFRTGRGAKSNDRQAALWYGKAADDGIAEAESLLGQMYFKGIGVDRDPVKGASLLKAAVAQGDVTAELSLGQLALSGQNVGLTQEAALGLLQRAAEQGEVRADFVLSNHYETAGATPDNQAQAISWARRAAETGRADGAAKLGEALILRNGPGDAAEAAVWLRRGADQGDATAEEDLGVLYLHGQGVAVDKALALTLMRKAADQGRVSAQTNLGLMYKQGQGTPTDPAEAVRWFQMAAARGDARGERQLGLALLNGSGLPVDRTAALIWFDRAAAQGDDLSRTAAQALRSAQPASAISSTTPPTPSR